MLFLIGEHPTPPTWKGFDFNRAVLRFEARIIERALKETGGIVARATTLLGLKRQAWDSMLKGSGRHAALAVVRVSIRHRRKSLMFRDEVECPETRAVVLHVEDDATISEPISTVLHDEGWSVETSATGAAALEKLRSGERFDVLIFDNKLPDTTGIELIKQTRALAHRQQTPIIMLSGDEVEAEAYRAGANEFLRKPGDLDSIPERVARLLVRKKRTESGAQ